MGSSPNSKLFTSLQADILRLEGFKVLSQNSTAVDLGPVNQSFPNGNFPQGAVHEFLAGDRDDQAAAAGFMVSLASQLTGPGGISLWVSASRIISPTGLHGLGIKPHHVIFVEVKTDEEVIWTMEEGLKCGALSSVVGEIGGGLTFTASRKLQLAVEQSGVTGFVLRPQGLSPATSACVSRWRITSLPSKPFENLPGLGFPRWHVELLRIRNGRTGSWVLEWINGRFVPEYTTLSESENFNDRSDPVIQRKVG